MKSIETKMILMNNFQAEPPELTEAMLSATKRVLESGWYVLGKEVTEFEASWSQVCGTKDCVGVGNGMDAIEIILRTLQIGVGDEVITTPMTAFATVLAIIRSGATPVLADIDSETALLSLESVQRCLSKKTKAIVLVHLYGQVRNMKNWADFCDQQKLHLIEDCAQAHLASWRGRSAGNFGIAGAYSFYPTKNLGAIGDGGAIVTNNENLANSAKRLRNYGQSMRYHHPEIGTNSRLDELQAAMLMEKLRYLVEFTNRRKKIANTYHVKINNPKIGKLALPEEIDAHVYHLYVVFSDERDELARYLQKHNIHTLIHYPIPAHQQKSCKHLQRDPIGLFNSEKHAENCLSIPCHPQMSDEDVERVISVLNSF